MPESSIFDYLSKYKLSEVTTELLDSSSKVTSIDKANLEFWQGVITVMRILQDSRTYPHGLPIPESGAVWSEDVAPAASAPARPGVPTEIWRVEHINALGTTATLTDGIKSSPIGDAASNHPFFVTNTLWLSFENATGAPISPTVAYSKVSL